MSGPQRAVIAYLRSRRDPAAWLSLGNIAGATARPVQGTTRTLASLIRRDIVERSVSAGRTFYRLKP